MSVIKDSQHWWFFWYLKVVGGLKGLSTLLWLKSIKSVHFIPKQLAFLILVNFILLFLFIFIKVSRHAWLHFLAIILIVHDHPISLLTVGISKHWILAFTAKLIAIIFEAWIAPTLRHESFYLIVIASAMIIAIDSSCVWRQGFTLKQGFTLAII